jgi:hypothetical protein
MGSDRPLDRGETLVNAGEVTQRGLFAPTITGYARISIEQQASAARDPATTGLPVKPFRGTAKCYVKELCGSWR